MVLYVENRSSMFFTEEFIFKGKVFMESDGKSGIIKCFS